jgi:hypothetical protein
MLAFSSCTYLLEEEPRSSYTAEYFKTPEGIAAALTSVYSDLRWFYGPIGLLYYSVCGTDEGTAGDNADGYAKNIDAYNFDTGVSTNNPIWDNTFPFINTCNGIIELGEEAGVDAGLIAEAKFLRAHHYFLLVRAYGGVPLDLGSGELKLNTTPLRFSVRNSVEEVYAAIIKDLQEAESVLTTPRLTGTASKVVAQHFLAKVYLTYGWWLERNGKSAGTYYQQAYDKALEAIRNPSPYGLQSTFRDVNLATNDRNAEWLFYADHTDQSYSYDDSASGSGNGPAEPNANHMKSNRSSFAITADFELTVNGSKFVWRQSVQDVGRPWRSIAPTYETLTRTFADKENDSRYEGTFTTLHRANYQAVLTYNGVVLKGMNDIEIVDGDTAHYYPTYEIDGLLPDPTVDGEGKSTPRFAYLPNKPYAIWTPSLTSRHNFPSCWKFGPHRSDQVPGTGSFNDASSRPFPIAKLSETYLIAAEAAVKGAQTQGGYSARDLVLILRKRAAKPGREDAIVAATPTSIDIDYILAERSRELWAECHRRFDLIRTGKLEEYAGSYSICESNNIVKQTNTRNIQSHHYLFPIPQGQFDNMDMTDDEKKNYQNPGYNIY